MIKPQITATSGRLLPAYPLFVKDPFFSIWSPSEKLNEGDTIFWTGARRRVYGVVSCDGKSYSFLGLVSGATKMEQTSVSLTAFSTIYEFASPDFDFAVSFTSPLPPDNLDLLSCPVCYCDYEIKPKKKLGKISVALFLHEESCYDRTPMPVRGGVHQLPEGECAWFGLKKQLVMSQAYDDSAAEWGYWYLLGEKAFLVSREAFAKYVAGGELDYFYDERSEKYIAAQNFHDGAQSAHGTLTLAFDDTLSIFYFGDWLKGYWFDGGRTIFDAISYATNERAAIDKSLSAFDEDLKKRANKYGDDYLLVLYGGLRQSVGAHKLVRDRDGEVLFLSKECHSNGCIATVDVSYPSIPLFLLYNPELVKGMMRPIFKFNDLPVWKYDFAPHDVGTYPYCLGQIYGLRGRRESIGKEVVDFTNHTTARSQIDQPYNYPILYNFPESADLYKLEGQMPVEECGNMLIMTAAAYLADGDDTIVKKNFGTLTDWVQYLVKYGLMPGEQLCTDDFAGHLDKNINLSVKAIVGIRAYAILAAAMGKKDKAAEYEKIAASYAAEWKKMCVKTGKQTPLVFDGQEDTFSLKYNMAFDVMFGTGLFDKLVRETETDYYITAAMKYGVPLDSRSTYTKSDWIVWAATLTDSVEKRKKIIEPVAKYLRESETHYPFSDWYYADNGKIRGELNVRGYHDGFKNRTVQGGLFILLLADSGIMKLK